MSEQTGLAGTVPTPVNRPDRAEASTDGVAPARADGSSRADASGGDRAAVQPEAETDVWTGRTHWKHYAGRLLLWLLANLLFAALVGWAGRHVEWITFARGLVIVAIVFVLSGLEVGVRRVWLRIIDHRYRLTTQRLFIERGILSRTIDQTELIRIDDVRLYQSLLDRVFGVGSVAIVSTDVTDRETVMEGIAEPQRVAEAIRTRMQATRRKSLFVEHL